MMNGNNIEGSAGEKTTGLYKSIQVTWYIFGVLEILLLFRFILKLLGANPAASFTDAIYNISYPFVAPFMAVFGITRVDENVFEWTTLLAMLVYWVIAMGIVKLFAMGKPVEEEEASRKIDAV